MSAVQTVALMIAAVMALLAPLAALGWWLYKLGQASGAERAKREEAERLRDEDRKEAARLQAENDTKIEALEKQFLETERQLQETRAELASLQPKRRRGLRSPQTYGIVLPSVH
jgi:uncharacterized protein HemX